jgi:O-antigen/teichoic acid export membrane protein
VAAFILPRLIELISIERFGLLTLAWGLVAFSGLFDLGIGRAVTQAVAQARGRGDIETIPATIDMARRLSIRLGFAGTCLFLVLISMGVHRLLKFDSGILNEVTISSYILAFVIPVQTLSATLRGISEAFEKFRGISLARIVVGSSTFLSPYLTALFSDSLVYAVFALVLSRTLGLIVYIFIARSCIWEIQQLKAQGPESQPLSSSARKEIARKLLKFGGWISVSSVIYPLMMQADRFLIGGMISSSAVAGYTIAYELVMQPLLLIGAVTAVAFPRLSALQGQHDYAAKKLVRKLLIYGVALMTVVTVVLAFSFGYVLRAWMGDALPQQAVAVGWVLCLGLIPYTIGTLVTSFIHSKGRADITGKAHLFQAPFYLSLLYFLILTYGIIGAAWAWTIRVLVDTIVITIWTWFARNPSPPLK